MRGLIMGIFLPADVQGPRLNGFFCSTLARFGRRFEVFHSREQVRAIIEALRDKAGADWADENLKYVELSTLPEASDRPVVSLPPLLAIHTAAILARTLKQEGPAAMEVVSSLKPRLCHALFPIDPAADDGLFAVMDGEPWVYAYASKEQARALAARHARVFAPDVYARYLARIDGCEFLPERADREVLAIDGYVGHVLCNLFDREMTRRAAAN